jgi:hypothetical protein
MSLGGFSGSDPAPTLSEFESLIAEGKVRYLVVQGGRGGGRAGAGARGGGVATLVSWAETHGQQVTVDGASGVTVYDLQGAATS